MTIPPKPAPAATPTCIRELYKLNITPGSSVLNEMTLYLRSGPGAQAAKAQVMRVGMMSNGVPFSIDNVRIEAVFNNIQIKMT